MANLVNIQDRIARLEESVRFETARLKDMQFEAELLRSRLSEITLKWGTYSEQDLISDPRFPGLMARLLKASIT